MTEKPSSLHANISEKNCKEQIRLLSEKNLCILLYTNPSKIVSISKITWKIQRKLHEEKEKKSERKEKKRYSVQEIDWYIMWK